MLCPAIVVLAFRSASATPSGYNYLPLHFRDFGSVVALSNMRKIRSQVRCRPLLRASNVSSHEPSLRFLWTPELEYLPGGPGIGFSRFARERLGIE